MRRPKQTELHSGFRSNRDIAIHVPDLTPAETFYGNILGFRVVARSNNYLEFDTGVLRLYANRDATARSFIPSFDVRDSKAARRHLEAAGCKTVHAGQANYFLDPFGFVFDIIERR